MKKFKNIKLMLLSLLVLGSVNAFGQTVYYAYDNLVYQVVGGSEEATFMGLNENAVIADDAVNDPTKISVPATISPRDADGNIHPFKVTAIWSNWATAKTGLGTFNTKAIGTDLVTLKFAAGVKLAANQVKAIFDPSFAATNLETLEIADGRNVDVIGNGTAQVAFKNTIKTVNIAGLTNDVDGDVELAAKLFYGAEKLTSVSLPTKSPVIIGEDAFRGTLGLKSFTFTGVKSIGDNAFKSSALTSLSIPATVESIGADAFATLTGATIKTVTITAGDKLTTIPAVFAGQSAIETITISGKATTIASGAFADAKAVKKIDLTGATELATVTGAFPASGYTKLEEAYFAGTKIKGGLFSLANITTLKKYSFPTTLEGALPSFEGCTNLEEITAIPAKVTSIPAKGFYNVGKLTAIDLSGATALTSIGTESFSLCAKLQTVDFSATKIGEIPAKAFKMSYDTKSVETQGYTEYPDGYWRKFNTALTKVTLPDVTNLKKADGKDMYALFTIGEEAFYGTAKLAEVVNLGQKKVTFGTNKAAFQLSGIKKVDFTNAVIKNSNGEYTSLITIPERTFWGAIALEEVTLPEGINDIQTSAFKYCVSLAKLNDNGLENLATIGIQAFRNTALTSLDLSGATSESFVAIPSAAFADIESLESVKLPAQISSIAPGAFAFATSLTSINLNQTSIETLNNLFTYDVDAASGDENDNDDEISLDKLTSLELEKDAAVTVDGEALPKLKVINDYALQFTGLEKVVIPSSVEYMGDGVFRACISLAEFEWTNVYGNNTGSGTYPAIVTLPDETFRGDVKLAKVTFLALAKTSELQPIKDKEVFFMCDKNLLKVYLTPDHYNVTVAAGYDNDNRTYSSLDVQGNVQFAFTEKNLAKDEFYYATYYNEVNASWFDATKFDVFSAVVDANKVVLKPATADGGYYKVARYTGSNENKAVCVVRSKDIKAVPELKSNDGNEYTSTFGDSELKVADGVNDKGSKLNYVFKLANVKGNVAFYRVTSGVFAEGKVFIEADPSAARLDIFVEGEGAVTGIDNLFGADVEDDAPVYNMQGARVNAAQKGVYIKNGKKFIVK